MLYKEIIKTIASCAQSSELQPTVIDYTDAGVLAIS